MSDNSENTNATPPGSTPFVPGDPRIWRGGQKNKAAVRFTKAMREAIVEMAEEEIEVVEGKGKNKRFRRSTRFQLLMDQVWTQALSGNQWFVQFIAEKVEGKVPTVIESFDLSKLSDEQLQRVADGEDLLSVLAG